MGVRTTFLLVPVLLMTVVSAQNSTTTPLLFGSTKTPLLFGSLPQANYSADGAPVIDSGSLQGIFDMAKGFVDVVFRPITDLAVFIEDIAEILIDSGEGETSESETSDYETLLEYFGENWEEIAKFEGGYITCLVFGLLFTILVPCVGCCMSCCRCCGVCGGQLKQSKKRSKSCWRQCLCVTMLILTTLMTVPTAFVFVDNKWMSEVVDNGPQKFVAVLDDTTEYLKLVPTQITYVSGQYNTVDDNVRPLVSDFGTSVGMPYQQYVEAESEESMKALGDAAQVQNNTLAAIDSANSAIAELSVGMVTVNASLINLQANMMSALSGSPCDTDTACIQVFESIDRLTVGFDVSEITPLSSELSGLSSEMSSFSITQQQENLENEINEIPNTVRNQTQSASNSAVETLDSAKEVADDVESELPTDGLNELESTVEKVSRILINATRKYDEDYDQYRYYSILTLGCMMAFIVVCYLLGMLLGICGHDEKVTPGRRGCASNCGGIWLMVGVGFSFIFSWLLMLMVVVLFSVGGHGERYGCQGFEGPDYQIFGIVKDALDVNLSETFGVPPEAELSVASLLESCEQDASIYSALKLEYVYNVSALLNNVTTQMSEIRGDLDGAVDDVDLSEIEIYSKKTQSELLALKSTSINTIDFEGYDEALGPGITETDLTEYSKFLRESAENFIDAASLQSMVLAQADEVDRIQTEEVDPLQDDYDDLAASLDQLEKTPSALNTTIDTLDAALVAFNNSIQMNSKEVIEEITDEIYDEVYGNVTQYTTWAGEQVVDEVGTCHPLYSAYTTSLGVFCDYLIDAINALWFSIGWCLFFLLPAAIIAMKLMKFFRTMSFEEEYETNWDETPVVTNQSPTPPPNAFAAVSNAGGETKNGGQTSKQNWNEVADDDAQSNDDHEEIELTTYPNNNNNQFEDW